MAPHHFETLLADARKRATDELGADADLRLVDVVLRVDVVTHPLEVPLVRFDARSHQSQKRSLIEYIGSVDLVRVFTLPFPVTDFEDWPKRPWVDDPSYIQLVHDSWRRVNRPFLGVAILTNYEPGRFGFASPWVITYITTMGGLPAQGEMFTAAMGKIRQLRGVGSP